MSSNNDWVVPTGADARRYCVLDMNSNRVGDFEYFSALIDESENGGDGALLHYLQCREIKSNLRVPPKTESLLDQKHLSMESHMAWWYECLSCGCIDEVDENGWPHRKPKKYVYAAYQMHCQAVKTRYPKSPEGIGKFLKGKLGYSDTKAPITVRV